MPTTINADELISRIKKLISRFSRYEKKKTTVLESDIKEDIASIEEYFAHPQCVQRASYLGGLEAIKERFASDLFRIKLYFNDERLKKTATAKKYPMVIKSWQTKWDFLSAYFKYSAEIRRLIYTINAIDGFHRQVRKIHKVKRGIYF